MKKYTLPSGIVQVINRRLGYMKITADEYIEEFSKNDCSENIILNLNSIITHIPDSGRQLSIDVAKSAHRLRDVVDDTNCMEVIDVTLPVLLSIIVCPFFWNNGENPFKKSPYILENSTVYAPIMFMNESLPITNFQNDYPLIKKILATCHPYIGAKINERNTTGELQEFFNIREDKLLSLLSYLGFAVYSESIQFPKINYSIGISKYPRKDKLLVGMEQVTNEYKIKCSHCGFEIDNVVYSDELTGMHGLGDVFDETELGGFCNYDCQIDSKKYEDELERD